MALSNTATPKYYKLFREAVMRGEIPVCEEINLQMQLIDGLIANPNVYYDDQAIDGFIAFCENEMTLTDGGPLELLFTFKLWAEDLLSWYYFDKIQVPVPMEGNRGIRYETVVVKRRLRNKQYLIVARGAAKSLYESLLQAYFLVIDTDTTKQITTAPTMKQAEEVLAPIRTAITRARGPLFKFLTVGSMQNTTGNRALRQKLASTKKGIENFLTESIIEIRPMSINKLQGLRTKINTVDEWLSGDLREDVIGALEQGASKVDDWIIVAVSSEGTVRNGPGDSIKLELMDILKGEYSNPHVSIWHYKLDNIDEVKNPAMWVKAQPNLGLTVSWRTYQLEVERAEKAPANRNDILAKRFGIPSEGHTFFFTYEETLPTPRIQRYWKMRCALGADLSMGDDFCAFTFLFPLPRGRFGIKTRSYISELTLKKLPSALRQKYDEFIREGSLHVMDGTILDLDQVYDDLDEYIIREQFEVMCFGYDPWGAKEFVNRYISENGEYGVERVQQGSRTESVPLGEIKKLAGSKLLVFDQAIMQFTMGNSMVLEDTNGNRKLWKRRYDEKIDNVSALLDAFVVYKLFKEMFE